MTGVYTFANTDRGRELRGQLVYTLTQGGLTCREFEEDFVDGDMTTHVLRLEVTGKRKGEGQIARDMKARKA